MLFETNSDIFINKIQKDFFENDMTLFYIVPDIISQTKCQN